MTHALPTPCRLFGGLHKILFHPSNNPTKTISLSKLWTFHGSFATTAAISSRFSSNGIPGNPDTY